MSCMCWRTAKSSAAAGRNWRGSWRKKAMPISSKAPREDGCNVMISQGTHKRGVNPSDGGGGGVFPPGFYQPENAASLLALFAGFTESHDGPEWLKTLRYGALTVVEQEGLPTPKLERWKYSNL